MTLFDVFRRKKKEEPESDDLVEALPIKSETPTSLYGGLCFLKAGHIIVAQSIAEAILDLTYLILYSNRQGYPVIHDRYLMLKVQPKHGIQNRKRRVFWFSNRQERKSLKKLGWKVINLKV